MENKTGEGAGGWCPVAEGGAGGGSSQDTVSRSSLSQGAACVAEDPEDRCHQPRLPEACFHEFSQMLQELRSSSQQDPREAVGVLWRIPQTSSLAISLTELSCQKPVQSSHSGLRDPQCLSVYSPSSSCENCEASTSSNTHSTGLLQVVNERSGQEDALLSPGDITKDTRGNSGPSSPDAQNNKIETLSP
ncbi:uncharacterized protein [Equus caballus]|uniref:uncharacterized protein isoform X5 n=1 Tax=Equus caballus TaxID=9796 RepID=UPI0038B2D917